MRFAALLLLAPLLSFAANPARIQARIVFEGEPAVALKTLYNGFSAVGYRLDVRSFSVRNKEGEISGEAHGIRPFDAAAFAENMAEEGVSVLNEGSSKGVFKIRMNARNGIWNVPLIAPEEGAQLERSAIPHWFGVEAGQTIRIESPYVGKWYPDVAVLDASMQVLYSVRSEVPKEEYAFDLPPGARYLKVSNTWGMKALREGTWVESKSPGR